MRIYNEQLTALIMPVILYWVQNNKHTTLEQFDVVFNSLIPLNERTIKNLSKIDILDLLNNSRLSTTDHRQFMVLDRRTDTVATFICNSPNLTLEEIGNSVGFDIQSIRSEYCHEKN